MRNVLPTDWRLWALLTGIGAAVFVPLAFFESVAQVNTLADALDIGMGIAGLLFLVAAAAWGLQAMAVSMGIRLSHSPDSRQAADYDDPPSTH